MNKKNNTNFVQVEGNVNKAIQGNITTTTTWPPVTGQVWPMDISGIRNQPEVADQIKQVIINDRTVIINWKDGTKSRSTCDVEDIFNPELGFAIAVIKKLIGKKRYTGFVEKALRQQKNRIRKIGRSALKSLANDTSEEFNITISLLP